MTRRTSFAASLPVQGNSDIEVQLLDRAFQRMRINLIMTALMSTVGTLLFWSFMPHREMLIWYLNGLFMVVTGFLLVRAHGARATR
jgi:hypothetical protein